MDGKSYRKPVDMRRSKDRVPNLFAWELIYFLILLFGLFPAVAESSLFQLTSSSQLDFLYGDLIQRSNLLNLLPVALLPIGLYIFFTNRKPWILIGLLPSIFTLTTILISKFSIIENINIFSYILFFTYKAALIVFIVKGHIRTLAFTTILVIAFFILAWKSVILFAFLALLLRTIFLTITQNARILGGIPRKKLARLFLRTLLAWSPILLFAIPGYIISYKMTKAAEQSVYDNTLVSPHAMYTKKKMKDIMMYNVKENLDAVGLDNVGYEKSQDILNTTLQVVKFRSDSLQYTDYLEGLNDFGELFTLYQQKFNPISPKSSTLFIIKHVSQDLEKVLIKRFLPGRNEFQLDIELSINEFYEEQQTNAKAKADSLNSNFKGEIDEKILDSQEKMNSLLAESRRLESRVQQGIDQNNEILINETRGLIANTRKEISESIDNVHNSIKSDIDAFPSKANATFEAGVPHELTDINPDFATKGCGLNIKCGAANLIKVLLIDAYAAQRGRSKKGVDQKSKELRDDANIRLTKAINSTKDKVETSLTTSEQKIEQLVNSGAGKASDANRQTINEANNGIIASVNIVSKQLVEIKNTSDDMKRKGHEGIELGVVSAKFITRKTFMSLYQGILFFSAFSNILLAILIIKSFFYVFSRITFAVKNKIYVQLKDDPKAFENGTLKKYGFEYSIPADFPEIMYVVKRYFPSGRAPKVAIPLWTDSVFSRVRSGAYIMNQITPRNDAEESVDFRAVKGSEFVEWNLSDGEEVVFDYKNLVAFSETLSLSSLVSFRITSMFLGRSIFRIAKGPGKLVLMTNGKPIINNGDIEEKVTRSVPIERIIAWQRTARFSIDTELSIADIYFSDLYLKRTNDDIIIIDADPGNIKRQAGLVKFVKRFLLPI